MSKVQVPVVFAAVACTLVAATACGQQRAGSPAHATATAAPPSSSPAAACGAAAPQAGRTVTITASDNEKSLCVKTGTEVLVFLRGTLRSKWAPIHSSSAALAPKPYGGLTLQVGVTGAAFEAARPGIATITSARNPCGPAASHSPRLECGVIMEYRVTLVITG
ncbi:MAG: hypothetical protein JOY82_16045 [Streptosporangiaceae bacterium]|nr:hypothetical protein [Streptosporangiaceae bacterium]MBV9856004.1 hypothetical protein [Streptosporangiaceae bacterium]